MGELQGIQDALIYTLGQNQSSGIRIFTDNLNHAAYRMKFFDVAESICSIGTNGFRFYSVTIRNPLRKSAPKYRSPHAHTHMYSTEYIHTSTVEPTT